MFKKSFFLFFFFFSAKNSVLWIHIIKKNLPSFWRKPVIDAVEGWKVLEQARQSMRGPVREGLMRASSSRLISKHCHRSPHSFVSILGGKKRGIIAQTLIFILPGAEHAPANGPLFPIKPMNPHSQNPRELFEAFHSCEVNIIEVTIHLCRTECQVSWEWGCSEEYAWKVQ